MADSFVTRLMHHAHSATARLRQIKEDSEEKIGMAKMLAEVTVANGALSYVNGRFGKEGSGVDTHMALVGVPIDLGAAVALGGLGLFGAFGKYSEDGFNLGVGALQSFTSRNLLSMGLSAGASTAGHHHSAGALPYGNPYTAGAYVPYGAYVPGSG